jgi:glycosyltransferase involved in cell wall biosynthesis
VKRIVHVVGSLDVGGAERNIARLIAGTRDQFDHLVVTIGPTGRLAPMLQAQGVVVSSAGEPSVGPWRRWQRLQDLVRGAQADVVHSWMHHANVATAAMRRLERPLVWGIRTMAHPWRERRMTGLVMVGSTALSRRPSRIVFNSHAAMQSHRRMGYPSQTGVVIPNGYDRSAYDATASEVRYWREAQDIPTYARILLQLGRLHPVKGHELLLRAFAEAAAGHPEWHLVVVGREDGVSQAHLRDQARAGGVADRVRFVAEEPDVRVCLQAAEMVALPSRWGESFPNVVAEAMAAGTMVVASDLGDVRDLIGDCGWVVPQSTVACWATALRTLLGEPECAHHARGHAGAMRVEAQFSKALFTARYAALLHEVE